MGTSRLQVAVTDGVAINSRLTEIVHSAFSFDEPVRILDAGCGRMWSWDLGSLPYHLTGLDSDAEALRLRVEVLGDLDTAIVGDLTSTESPSEASRHRS